jgi:Protein of unknown function (DUF3147)
MISTLLVRFFIGGLFVIAFAILGDIFRPKSFAGLFGAAPSVALATLSLTIHKQGAAYAAIDARSMIAGAIAFFVYACAVSWILMRYRPPTPVPTIGLMPLWFAVAFGLWAVVLR